MRRGIKHQADEVEVDMTPMLDIVFILLIFFIVTAVFVQEHDISLVPPPPSDKAPTKVNPVILIQITDRNVVFVNDQLTDLRRVGPAIERFRADKGDSSILVVPDDKASHGVVIKIYDAAKRTGAPTMIQRKKGET